MHALDRHLALIGFMGAGKSTVGREVAERLGRPFVDLDDEVEREADTTIAELWRREGEPAFRALEERVTIDRLERVVTPAVLALGGGAPRSAGVRAELKERAFTVLLEVDPADAWRRAAGAARPLARDENEFRQLYEERLPVYGVAADAAADDTDGVVLAAGGIHVGLGAVELLGELLPPGGGVALVSEPHVAGIHGPAAQVAVGERLSSIHELPSGEAAKTGAACERLWGELMLERGGLVVALGGGCLTDAAGFVAATYLRGVRWAPVPTTLVGQVDAAIGGKTAINSTRGKNLVGAFHWPERVVVDPALLETLPERERRNGMSEALKTGLLAGEPLWELADGEMVRRCAAFKTALCLRDPFDRGPREALNLGHTFAHALEAAADFTLPHGEAVALGLLAALRLSEAAPDLLEAVESVLQPKLVRVDRDRAWAALQRDKKVSDGRIRLVLLEGWGRPVTGVQRDEREVRRALDGLIAG